MLAPAVMTSPANDHDAHMPETQETALVPRSDLIAVSRLLWDIGSQQSPGHQHQVDCFHWGARLDQLDYHLIRPRANPSVR